MSQPFADFPVPAKQVPADFAKSGQSLVIFLDRADLLGAARYLYENQYVIEDVVGLDLAEGLSAVYHFCHFEKPGRVTLRVLAPHDDPVVPSLAGIFQGAEWHERETADFFGIKFAGIPNDGALLLPDDQEIAPPLLKDDARRAVLAKAWPYEAMGENPVPPAKPAPAAKPAAPKAGSEVKA